MRQQQLPTNAQKQGARAIVAASAGLKCPLRPVIAARKCASRWHPAAAMAVARRWRRRQAQGPLVQTTHAWSEQHGGARNPQIHRQGPGEGRAGLWHPCIGRLLGQSPERAPGNKHGGHRQQHEVAFHNALHSRRQMEATLCAYMVAR